jgi:hypothetical protein
MSFGIIFNLKESRGEIADIHTAKTVYGNSKKIFPEIKLRGLNTNSYIHVSVSDLCTYSHDRSAYSSAGK